ncbi:toll-like receptor 6 [Oculina patagonica]
MKGSLIILCCLVLAAIKATGQVTSFKLCPASFCISKKMSSFFETDKGIVPVQAVKCALKSNKINDRCTVDIGVILKTLTTSQDVVLYFAPMCLTPMEIVFNNSLNATKKNAISYLQIKGQCSVSVDDISHWGNATDFRVFYVLENATLLEGNNSLGNNSLQALQNVGSVLIDKSKPRNIPSMFSKYVWSRMAEVGFSNLQLTTIPAEFNTTMPQLQSLELANNKLTKPPSFPWCNTTLQLPRGLQRTPTGNHHYQFGTNVHPKIYRRFFDLSYNKIEDLSKHEFRGLLNKLTLQGNGLKVIGPTCFRNLTGIHVIDLSKNKLNDLPSELFQGLDSLLELRLDHNNISVIRKELFKSVTQIERIDLNGNKLSYIPKELFSKLKNIKVLHLEDNQITRVDEKAFPIDSSSLEKIYLQNNNISRIPTSLLLQRSATETDLSFNQLTFQDFNRLLQELDYDAFMFQHRETASSPQVRMQESLKYISFANNKFTTINIEAFNKTEEIKFEYLLRVYKIDMTGNPLMCDCKILFLTRWLRALVHRVTRIRKEQFQTWKCAAPSELKGKSILSVDEDQFQCQRNLENCPSGCLCFVRALDGTVVIDCKGRNLTAVPPKVPCGRIELNLQDNDIREIPPYPYMENVTALYLTQNKIQVLNDSTVQKFTRIKILFIDSNKLTDLPRNIEKVNFTTLVLHHNFFKCDCKTKWMKNWLRRKESQILNIENVLCNSEGSAQGKSIYTLPDDEFVCKQNVEDKSPQSITKDKTFRIIALTLGSSLVLTIIAFILVYKFRGEIKVFMYTHFNWHPFDRIDDLDPSKTYDAFVSFSGNDYQWVVNTLQERLENHDPPYKLCIHQRDFLVGAPIQENILNSVDQSKRMLMVLSRDFLRSEWCLLEFRAAHRKVLEERMNYLIIILFDDVNMDELDDEMKLYMRTNTYLSVSNKWFWEKLYYAMPQSTVAEFRARHLSSTSSNAGLEYSTETVHKNGAYLKETVILE